MESRKRRDDTYCDHCDQYVTKSTYRWYQLMRRKRKREPVENSSSNCSSGTESDISCGLDSSNDLNEDQATCKACLHENNVTCDFDDQSTMPQAEIDASMEVENDLENDLETVEDVSSVSESDAYKTSEEEDGDDYQQDISQDNSDI